MKKNVFCKNTRRGKEKFAVSRLYVFILMKMDFLQSAYYKKIL